MTAADTNLFVYAINRSVPQHEPAKRFIQENFSNRHFVVCEFVLHEVWMQLRNPAIFDQPLSPVQAADQCLAWRDNPNWTVVDYEPQVAEALWKWARNTKRGFRQLIDARLALTLRHHGVTHFATANTRDFTGFGFARVWNPLAG